MSSPTLKTVTLGCKVNQYETQYAREGFRLLGYRDAVDGEKADLILVNSCTVTADSEAKSRKIIRRLAKKYPQAEIIVMGCYATRMPDEAASLPGVVEVLEDKRQLPVLLARWGLSDVPNGISTFEGRHRAWVKVQDGCRERCSYCIIPIVRPVLASRPIDEVLDEIGRLTAAGFAEIVLTGIHLGHYGADFEILPSPSGRGASEILPSPFGRGARGEGVSNASTLTLTLSQRERELGKNISGHSLTDLIRRIMTLNGEFRLRLSSIEAAEVTPELLDIMAEHPQRICPHLHIPMQSGSEAILKKMRRRMPLEQFIDRCREIHRRLDLPALTTDVIVGFPGETEEDFAATCRAVEEAGFSKIHVFRFSPRQGTEAASMPNRVPQRVHRQWAAELANLEKRLSHRYLESLHGKTLQVLVEGEMGTGPICQDGDRSDLPERPEGGHRRAALVVAQIGPVPLYSHKLDLSPFPTLLGTADRYATVELPGRADLIGRLINVRAGRFFQGHLQADAI
jgi:threonylcarbamoyladenosine tRNA methylthiotransferase MtaB